MLSKLEVNTTTPKESNQSLDNQEVGFAPFLGRTTTTLNFRSGPSSKHTKIKPIYIGSTIFVYSNNRINEYYKGIDVVSGQIGWAHKNYVKHFQAVELDQEQAFQSIGYTASEFPEITIENSSSQMVKLVLGTDIISMDPNVTRSIKIKPGLTHYILIKPGHIPTAGYQLFESNKEYKWEF